MAKHIHIHFAPRRTRDQAPGSVPTRVTSAARRVLDAAPDVMPLVEALMQAIADRQGAGTEDTMTEDEVWTRTQTPKGMKTTDAGEWEEHKHPRGDGGRFSSGEHLAAASNHEAAAAAHENSANMAGQGPLAAAHAGAAKAHTEAAQQHADAAKHIRANTGLGGAIGEGSHKASFKAASLSKKLDSVAGGNTMGAAYKQLKAVAADPKAPLAKRADAVKKLGEIEKATSAVAKSPHAAPADPMGEDPAKAAMAGPSGKLPERRDAKGMTVSSMQNVQARMDAKAAAAPAPDAGAGPAGPKPTQGPGGPAKAATHALLSSGHPFSVEELMTATGVTSKSTMMTALSDLKNPKYAGKLGALAIEKGADGQYRVTKAPEGGFKAVGAPNASAAPAAAGQAATPGSVGRGAAPGEEGYDPHSVVHGSHPLSDYMPGQKLTAKGAKATQYSVLGHNAEGHVVLQGPNGKHRMEPSALKAATVANSPGKAPPGAEEAATAALEAHSGPHDDKSMEIAGSEAGEDQKRLDAHTASLAKKGQLPNRLASALLTDPKTKKVNTPGKA